MSLLTAHAGVMAEKAIVGGSLLSLLHFDGPDGSDTFTDETGRSWSLNNATISTIAYLYGGASGLFGGNASIYSTSPGDALGSDDFLVEISGNFVTLGTNIIVDMRGESNNQPMPAIYNVGTTLYYYVNGANVITAKGALATGAWKRIAVSRQGGVTRMFVDGVQVGKDWPDATIYTNTKITLGSNWQITGTYIHGWLDEFRLQKGIGIDSNYTPIGPFPNP